MDALYLTLLIIILVGIGIIFAVSYGIYKFIHKKEFDKRLRLLALTPIIIVSYFVYRAFYPNEEFYKEDFREVAGMDFPASGVIEYKWASYPDQFGDYTSISLVKTDKKFYTQLLQELPNQEFRKPREDDFGLLEYSLIKVELKDRKIEQEYILSKSSGLVYYIGFISDQETIIIQRASW
jgi:hypothetical protein